MFKPVLPHLFFFTLQNTYAALDTCSFYVRHDSVDLGEPWKCDRKIREKNVAVPRAPEGFYKEIKYFVIDIIHYGI